MPEADRLFVVRNPKGTFRENGRAKYTEIFRSKGPGRFS